MSSLLEVTVSNMLLAAALALVAIAASCWWKNPRVAHWLWVIVLAKLVTPPLWSVPLGWTTIEDPKSATFDVSNRTTSPAPRTFSVARAPEASFAAAEPVELPGSRSAERGVRPAVAAVRIPTEAREVGSDRTVVSGTPAPEWIARHGVSCLVGLWVASSLFCGLIVAARILRFHRMLREGRPAEESLIARVESVAERMGLRSFPDMRLLDRVISPMVWPLGRRRMLLLPQQLVEELTEQQLDTVIAHELAHLVRRDELVRFLETFVTCLFWWNPVVWLARRELHAAEEDCCDALVICALPASRKPYAEALLHAAELTAYGQPTLTLASTLISQRPLKWRIQMILKHKFVTTISWRTKLSLVVLSLVVLPLAATATSQEGSSSTVAEPSNANVSPPERPSIADPLAAKPDANSKSIRPLSSLVGADTHITAHEQLRILDEETWVRYWLRHTGQSGTPADYSETRPSGAPQIDFEQCMILAITESPGQWNSGIRVVSMTESQQELAVFFEDMPYQARAGVPAPGNAYGFFVVSRSTKAIVFYRNVLEDRGRMISKPRVWKEIRRIAAIEAAPGIAPQQAHNDLERGNDLQSLRSDSGPKLGTGLQSAPANPEPLNRFATRTAFNIGFAHDPGPGRYNGVVGNSHDVWNFVDIGTTAVDYLRSADGQGTPMTLKVSRHDGEWGIQGTSGIFHGYIYHNCQCVDLSATISGLPAGRYKAYVYAHGDAPEQNADVELAVGADSLSRKATLNDGSWKFRSETFEEGVQYVSFEFTAQADQPVTITSHRAGSGYSMLNAIQIVPVDAEP